jgi:hypothetical protein
MYGMLCVDMAVGVWLMVAVSALASAECASTNDRPCPPSGPPLPRLMLLTRRPLSAGTDRPPLTLSYLHVNTHTLVLHLSDLPRAARLHHTLRHRRSGRVRARQRRPQRRHLEPCRHHLPLPHRHYPHRHLLVHVRNSQWCIDERTSLLSFFSLAAKLFPLSQTLVSSTTGRP